MAQVDGVVQQLKQLVNLKQAGELTKEEFAQAKKLALSEQEADQADIFSERANATNRPQEDGKKYRRRSVNDFLVRINKDLKGASADSEEDQRKKKMLDVTVGIVTSLGEDSTKASQETVDNMFKQFYTEDGFQEFVFPPGVESPVAGRWLVSGGAPRLQHMWFLFAQYHFDLAASTIVAFNNELIMDFSWYKIISLKGDKKGTPYQVKSKLRQVFNDDLTKIKSLTFYFEQEEHVKEWLQMEKDLNIAEELEKKGLKAGGDAKATVLATI